MPSHTKFRFMSDSQPQDRSPVTRDFGREKAGPVTQATTARRQAGPLPILPSIVSLETAE
jgi:hypothetical protein